MNQPLIEKKPNDASERFRTMATRIDHNADAKFGGAVVIYPPEGGGEPIELLILDTSGNAAQFYGAIMSRIQTIVQEVQDRARLAQGFGGR